MFHNRHSSLLGVGYDAVRRKSHRMIKIIKIRAVHGYPFRGSLSPTTYRYFTLIRAFLQAFCDTKENPPDL